MSFYSRQLLSVPTLHTFIGGSRLPSLAGEAHDALMAGSYFPVVKVVTDRGSRERGLHSSFYAL